MGGLLVKVEAVPLEVLHDAFHRHRVQVSQLSDAGISSEDNLALIKEKGFHYLCVSRKNLTEYELAEDARTVTVLDSRKQPIRLTEVKSTANGDHYLLVNSPSKALTEDSMNRQYRQRFEDMLEAVKKGLSTKGGTKKYEKVCERVGRARGKYPSVQRFYDISYVLDEKKEKVNVFFNAPISIRYGH